MKSLAEKLNAVMGSMERMVAEGKMQGGKTYRYLTEEQLVTTCHDLFTQHKLVMVPHNMGIISECEYTTSGGAIMRNVRIFVQYLFLDADTGEQLEVMALGEGSDTGDKAVNKAMTGALKYALRQSILVASGDDPDKEASPERSFAGNRRPNSRAAAPPATVTAEKAKEISRMLSDLFDEDRNAKAAFLQATIKRVCKPAELNIREAAQLIAAATDIRKDRQ